MSVVELRNLVVKLGRNVAVREITMCFDGGFMVLLGPNGAGKTTILSTVAGLYKPYEGVCRVLGRECIRNRIEGFNDIVFTFERPPSIHLRVSELYSRICEVRDCDYSKFLEFLECFGLKPSRVLNSRFDAFSAGERMKVYLAALLSLPAKLYLLDEPNVNLDVDSREVLAEILGKISSRASLVVSTHLYEYIEDLATHVALMYGGRLVFAGRVQDVMKEFSDVCIVRARAGKEQELERAMIRLGARYRRISERTFLVFRCSELGDVTSMESAVRSIVKGSLRVVYHAMLKGDQS